MAAVRDSIRHALGGSESNTSVVFREQIRFSVTYTNISVDALRVAIQDKACAAFSECTVKVIESKAGRALAASSSASTASVVVTRTLQPNDSLSTHDVSAGAIAEQLGVPAAAVSVQGLEELVEVTVTITEQGDPAFSELQADNSRITSALAAELDVPVSNVMLISSNLIMPPSPPPALPPPSPLPPILPPIDGHDSSLSNNSTSKSNTWVVPVVVVLVLLLLLVGAVILWYVRRIRHKAPAITITGEDDRRIQVVKAERNTGKSGSFDNMLKKARSAKASAKANLLQRLRNRQSIIIGGQDNDDVDPEESHSSPTGRFSDPAEVTSYI